MLNIQRASAGSGKTYTLAKNYILNLIAYKSENGKWKLRNERQIEDAIQHILAITFTNKATNEMKQRIVTNLSLLAQASQNDLPENVLKRIPYLKDFNKILGVDYKSIGHSADLALKTVLNNYSQFKISTIDSFFQEILRTFAFEANINDSYQLEIDSTFVSDSAVEATIHELDTNPDRMGNASLWLKIIMQNEARKTQMWNPFNKNRSSRSLYNKIRNAIIRLEREDFKEIKDSLDLYFKDEDKIRQFAGVYFNLKDKAIKERKDLLEKILEKAANIENIMLANPEYGDQLNKNFIKQLGRIAGMTLSSELSLSYSKFREDNSVFSKKFREPDNSLDREAMEMYDLLDIWQNPPKESYHKNWKVYGELLPYLGLILEIRKFLSQILESNNLIQLSDTSFILKKIIGDDDAPFVYERLGNRLDIYLIDEFQDTSRMQWDIIYPLISEALSKDKESLIIGDPKQSIYRFRNADHRLITEVVPKVFPGHKESGMSREENTNWRSNTRIVLFNNFFFKTLARLLTDLSKIKGGNRDFNSLYSNVVQYPHNNEGKGYVEVRSFSKNLSEGTGDGKNITDDSQWFKQKSTANIGPLITSLIRRGYSFKEIGILVNTNEGGKEVVESLIEYNSSLTSREMKIDFISEESLLISSSAAVDIVINVLEKISNPTKGNNYQKETDSDKEQLRIGQKYYNWNELRVDYNIYSKQHSETPLAQRIIDFLNNTENKGSIEELMENLPSPTLSAIVEEIINIFVDEGLKRTDALYLASFQDIVTEYSANHPDYPAAFLEWWQARGNKMSVASPEGIDAVQIMTIHKSKGLEFKCVIIPFASDNFMPSGIKEEWRWEKPIHLEGLELPPYVPVKTSFELIGSIHENIQLEYVDQVITDILNMYYVAFTRAKNELYVFTKEKDRVTTTIVSYLHNILNGKESPQEITEEENEWLADKTDFIPLEFTESLTSTFPKSPELWCSEIIAYGEPFTLEENLSESNKEKELKRGGVTTNYFKEYKINKTRPNIRSKAKKVLPSGELE